MLKSMNKPDVLRKELRTTKYNYEQAKSTIDELIFENDFMRQQLDFLLSEIADISMVFREFLIKNPSFLSSHLVYKEKLISIRERLNHLIISDSCENPIKSYMK